MSVNSAIRFAMAIALLGSAVILQGCGGGGGGGGNSPPPTPKVSISGVATDDPINNGAVSVFNLAGAQLASGRTSSDGKYSIEVDPKAVLDGFRISVSGGTHSGQPFSDELKAIYGPADSKSAANLTLLTSLVAELANGEAGANLIAKRDAAINRLLGPGLILNREEWSHTAPLSVDVNGLRSIVGALGLHQWSSQVAAALRAGELPVELMEGFPNAHGGIFAIGLGDRSGTVGFPGDKLRERLRVFGLTTPTRPYTYELLVAPGFAALEGDGVLSLSIPENQAPGGVPVDISVTNPDTGRGRIFHTQLYVMPTEVVASGTVDAAGGQIASPWRDVVLTIPPNAVTGIATFQVLRGELPSGHYAYKVHTTAELHAPPQLLTPTPQQRVLELQNTPAAPSAVVRDKRNSQNVGLSAKGRVEGGNWKLWQTWSAKLLQVRDASPLRDGVYVNRLRNDLWKAGDPPEDIDLIPLNEPVASQLFSLCGSPDAYTCAGREPVLFVHGFIAPGLVDIVSNFDPIPPLGGGQVYWNQFPELLSSEYAVFEFNWMTAARFQDVGNDLAEAISQITRVTGKKVHVVAHSFGGLLVRTYVQGLAVTPAGDKRAYADDVATLTTLGTPHSGISDTQIVRSAIRFPGGQDSDLEFFEGCTQISCMEAGEPTPEAVKLDRLIFPDIALQDYFGTSSGATREQSGNLVTDLANSKIPVHTQVLFGLTGQTIDDISFFFRHGDGLISFVGQRFHPSLSCNSSSCTEKSLTSNSGELAKFKTSSAIDLEEKILGFPASTVPGNAVPRGATLYRHTGLGSRSSGISHVGEATVGGKFGCSGTPVIHDACKQVLAWLDVEKHKAIAVPKKTISFNFTVRDGSSGAPLSGARIIMSEAYNGTPPATGSNGSASLEAVFIPNSRYVVSIRKPGYRVVDQLPVYTSGAQIPSQPVNAPIVFLYLDSDEPVLGQLDGHITDAASGSALAGAQVFVYKAGRDSPDKSTTADRNGDYRFAALPEGMYQIRGSKAGYEEKTLDVTVNPDATSKWDLALQKSVVTAAPAVPLLLDVAATASDHVQFRFRDQSGNEAGFEVQRKAGSGSYQSFRQLPPSPGSNLPVSVDDATVSPSTSYCYRALASNAAGNSAFSDPACTSTPSGTATGAPAAPTELSATPAGSGGIVVSFRDNANNESSLQVLRKKGTGAYAVVQTLAAAAGSGGLVSYADGTVVGGETYCYRASATNAAGQATSVQESCATASVMVVTAPRIVRVSIGTEGNEANSGSPGNGYDMSSDGRFVVFESEASNLVPGDTNGRSDVFIRDRDTDNDRVFDEPGNVATRQVSVSSMGVQGNSASGNATVSADGRFVAFHSIASNLVVGDTNSEYDVFVRDRDTDRDGIFDEPGGVATTRVSLSSAGEQGNGISPSISADGRFVAFESSASNFVAGATGTREKIFVRDRDTDRDGIFDEPGNSVTTLISSGQGQGFDAFNPSISADGRFVAFDSGSPTLAPLGEDTNGVFDVFVADRDSDQDGIFDESDGASIARVSASSAGAQGDTGSFLIPSLSEISADGRFVTFTSYATNLVSGDTNGAADAFIRDRDTDRDGVFDEPGAVSTVRVSLSSTGEQGNTDSLYPASPSFDGRFVAFQSNALNLVSGDTNGETDAFVRDRDTDQDGVFDEPGMVATVRISVSGEGEQGNIYGSVPSFSADGRFASFGAASSNLVPGDTNNSVDVFVVDLRRLLDLP